MIEIQAEAERLRRMVDDEVHRIAISARTEYESARANEETIAAMRRSSGPTPPDQ